MQFYHFTTETIKFQDHLCADRNVKFLSFFFSSFHTVVLMITTS